MCAVHVYLCFPSRKNGCKGEKVHVRIPWTFEFEFELCWQVVTERDGLVRERQQWLDHMQVITIASLAVLATLAIASSWLLSRALR